VPGDRVVAQAISNVRDRYSSEQWESLLPRELTSEIYQEIRRLDLQRTAAWIGRPVVEENAA